VNAVILGASYDSPEANKKFAEKFKFNYDLLSDTDQSLAKAYGAYEAGSSTPRRAAFVIGEDGKVLHSWEKVKAAEFPGEVLQLVGGKETSA
jgi:peroxiredoxin Q/BCP